MPRLVNDLAPDVFEALPVRLFETLAMAKHAERQYDNCNAVLSARVSLTTPGQRATGEHGHWVHIEDCTGETIYWISATVYRDAVQTCGFAAGVAR